MGLREGEGEGGLSEGGRGAEGGGGAASPGSRTWGKRTIQSVSAVIRLLCACLTRLRWLIQPAQ